MPAGRPLKNGVTYFPLEVTLDDKFELIEAEHGIVGFGVIIKLYQKIYADNYYIIWDKKALLVFSNRINVDINSINAIINSCLEWDVFSKKLFDKFQVLTSKGIQERFFFIAKRRKFLVVCKELMLTIIDINAYKKVEYVDINSQRKGKVKGKVKGKGKGKKKLFIPPSLEESENFAFEKGYTKQIGKTAFEYYSNQEPPWTDRNGKQVKSWKSKMIAVWFKDEYKIQGKISKVEKDENLKRFRKMTGDELKKYSEGGNVFAFEILRERGEAID